MKILDAMLIVYASPKLNMIEQLKMLSKVSAVLLDSTAYEHTAYQAMEITMAPVESLILVCKYLQAYDHMIKKHIVHVGEHMSPREVQQVEIIADIDVLEGLVQEMNK